MAFTFSIETVVRGYHVYKEIWNAAVVSRGQTAFFRFYLWWRKKATTNKTEKSGLATRDYAAVDGAELPCEREIGNVRDPFAVAIKKATPTGNVTVGHTPRVVSPVCSVFIRRGGIIVCV